MGIAIGTYDRRITLQQNQSTQSASGQSSFVWVNVIENLPARYVDESQSGGQNLESDQRVSASNVSFHIRDPRGAFPVKPGMQVLCDGNIYNINHVAEIGRRVAFALRCEMKDNT